MPIPAPFSPKWVLLICGVVLLLFSSMFFLAGIVIISEGEDRAFGVVLSGIGGFLIIVSVLMISSAFKSPDDAETLFYSHLSPLELKDRAKTAADREAANVRLAEAAVIAATLTPDDRATVEEIKAQAFNSPSHDQVLDILQSVSDAATPEMANHKLRAVAFAVKPTPRSRYIKGVLLGLWAWCGFLISIALTTLLLGRAGGLLLSKTLSIRRRARRYRLNPQGVLGHEMRDPILYLRSFSDDYDGRQEGFFTNTYEQRLVVPYGRYGPVVAVGRPKEELPLLGALRLYFDERTWRAGVLYLMSVAQAIIIHAGIAPGLLWELAAARQRVEPQRLIISFVEWFELDSYQRRMHYLRFKKYAQEVLGCKLPAEIEVSDYITFDADWNPQVWCSKNRLPVFLSSRGWGLKFPPLPFK